MDTWCPATDEVPDNDRIYRCSECGRRLYPRGYRLRRHKRKGWKIKRAKQRKLGGRHGKNKT